MVGPTAVLGRRRGLQFFRLNRAYSWWLEVDKGPDAAPLQLVQLPHWFDKRAANAMPSGFGPYSLVRLSEQTGGSFTIYDRLAERSRYRLEDLRAYLPDYRDAATIENEFRQSPLRRAVIEAARLTAQAGDRAPPILDFDFDYWYPPAEYQQKVAALVLADLHHVNRVRLLIERALDVLQQPETEAALKEEESLRWQADYLLARGRLLALSVRYREYELLATALLQGKVLAAATTRAEFQASTQLNSGDWGVKRQEEAHRFLTQCAEKHAGTPWGDLAGLEMRHPSGLRVFQRVTQPSGVAMPGPGSPTPPRL